MSQSKEISNATQKLIARSQIVTMGDLEDFKQELFARIQNLITEIKPALNKKWLKSHEVKKMLGISTGTLQNLRNNGTLPFTKIGGTIYYDRDDISNVLVKHIEKNSDTSFMSRL